MINRVVANKNLLNFSMKCYFVKSDYRWNLIEGPIALKEKKL